MITKGIITAIDFTGNTCTVRMPFFETANNDPITGIATVSNTPGSYNGYKVGDVVWVAFENGQMDTPVILGKLYLGIENEKADPRGAFSIENINITKSATMPADSKLASEVDKNVPNTTAPFSSISSIANNLNSLNTEVNQFEKFANNQFKSVINEIDAQGKQFSSELAQTANEISANVNKKLDSESTLDPAKERGLGWALTDNKWVINATDTVDTNNDGIEDTKKTLPVVTIDRSGMSIAGDLKIVGYPKEITTKYLSQAASAANPTTATAGWEATIPQWVDGYHIWQWTRTIKYDYDPDYIDPETHEKIGRWLTRNDDKIVDITGATGASGAPGAPATQYYLHRVYCDEYTANEDYNNYTDEQIDAARNYSTTDARKYVGIYVDTTQADAAHFTIANNKAGIVWSQLLAENATSYWLTTSTSIHTGRNQDSNIIINAIKKIGEDIDRPDTAAYIRYSINNGASWRSWTQGSSITINKTDIRNADILIQATHDTTASPIVLFDAETITFAPLDTPVIDLNNDNAAIAYYGSVKLGTNVSSTARVYLGTTQQAATYSWVLSNCDGSGQNTDTVTISRLDADEATATVTATCTNLKDENGDAVQLTKVFTITKQISAAQFWIKSSTPIHTGTLQKTAITLTPMIKIGDETEREETLNTDAAYIRYKWKNDANYGSWIKGTVTITTANCADQDLLVEAAHQIVDSNNNTNYNIYDTETITYSPLNTPVIDLTNDNASLPYDGNDIIGNIAPTVSSTAKVYLNGKELPITETIDGNTVTNYQLAWTVIDNTCTIASNNNTVTVSALATDTAIARCTVTNIRDYAGLTISKDFTISKQLKGARGRDGQGAYTLIIDNDFDSIPCDKNGTPPSNYDWEGQTGHNVTAYEGATQISYGNTIYEDSLPQNPDANTYYLVYTEHNLEWINGRMSSPATTAYVEWATNSTETAGSIIYNLYKGSTLVATASFEAIKIITGDSAVDYYILSSVSQVNKPKNSAALDPTTVTFNFYKKVGSDGPTDFTGTDGAKYRYSLNKGSTWTPASGYISLSGNNSSFTYTPDFATFNSILVELYATIDGTDYLVDKESVSMIADGEKGDDGIAIKEVNTLYNNCNWAMGAASPLDNTEPNYGTAADKNMWLKVLPEAANGYTVYSCIQTIFDDDDPDGSQHAGAITRHITYTTAVPDYVYRLAQGKTTNYYSENDPAGTIGSNTYGATVKEGDSWFCLGYYAVAQKTTNSNVKDYTEQKYYYEDSTDHYTLITESNWNSIATDANIYVHNALFQWGPDDPDAQTLTYGWQAIDGEIITNKVTANYINAMDITAKKITVLNNNIAPESSTNPILFEADGLSGTGTAQIAGFKVDANSIYKPKRIANTDYKLGYTENILMSSGTPESADIGGSGVVNNWNFVAGTHFGVRTNTTDPNNPQSELYVDNGKIGGFTINSDTLCNDANTTKIPGSVGSVYLSTGKTSTVNIAGSGTSSNTWALTASNRFGVTTNGYLYANRGKIGGFTLADDKLTGNTLNVTNDYVEVYADSTNNIKLSLYEEQNNDTTPAILISKRGIIADNEKKTGFEFTGTSLTEHIVYYLYIDNYWYSGNDDKWTPYEKIDSTHYKIPINIEVYDSNYLPATIEDTVTLPISCKVQFHYADATDRSTSGGSTTRPYYAEGDYNKKLATGTLNGNITLPVGFSGGLAYAVIFNSHASQGSGSWEIELSNIKVCSDIRYDYGMWYSTWETLVPSDKTALWCNIGSLSAPNYVPSSYSPYGSTPAHFEWAGLCGAHPTDSSYLGQGERGYQVSDLGNITVANNVVKSFGSIVPKIDDSNVTFIIECTGVTPTATESVTPVLGIYTVDWNGTSKEGWLWNQQATPSSSTKFFTLKDRTKITFGSTEFYPVTYSNNTYTVDTNAISNSSYRYKAKAVKDLNKVNLGSNLNRWSALYTTELYSTNPTIQTSDKKAKINVNYDLQKYDTFFDTLKPVSFNFAQNTSGRTHLGFIAQDIQENLDQNNLTRKDFAGLVLSGKGFDAENDMILNENSTTYGIRYSELHALEVHEIQKLKQQVKDLQAEIQELKNKDAK